MKYIYIYTSVSSLCYFVLASTNHAPVDNKKSRISGIFITTWFTQGEIIHSLQPLKYMEPES